jgi:hypothetical protein
VNAIEDGIAVVLAEQALILEENLDRRPARGAHWQAQ